MARRKQKKSKGPMIAAGVFIFIMATSIVGLLWSEDPSTSQTYGDYTFDLTQRGWIAKVNGQNMFFDYTPDETLNVDLPQDMVQAIKNSPIVWFTSSVNDSYRGEIATVQVDIIQQLIESNSVAAVGFTDQATPLVPRIDCTNASQFLPVVFIKEADETKARSENGCFTLEVSSIYDLDLFRTRMRYELLGVMQT